MMMKGSIEFIAQDASSGAVSSPPLSFPLFCQKPEEYCSPPQQVTLFSDYIVYIFIVILSITWAGQMIWINRYVLRCSLSNNSHQGV